MSFGWLFALVAGAIILFFAIYFTVRLIGTEKETVGAETGKEIGILLNPLETGFESAQTTSITIPAETRIHNSCDEVGDFGRQIIQLDQKNFGKWVETDVSVSFNNKYIFSIQEIEGKKFYIFSKPFIFPFKIADLVYMTSSNDIYCFINAPGDMEEELTSLNQSNLLVENCPAGAIKVCFNGNCEIDVDLVSQTVNKGGEDMYFTDSGENSRALMYAAIFSNPETYECQLKRLMTRIKELSLIYMDKEKLIGKKGCDNNLEGDLTELSNLADSLAGSEELEIIKIKVDDINEKNSGRVCVLW